MSIINKKHIKLISILLFSIFLTGMTTSDYTRKVKPLPDMPTGNPDPNLGIVVHDHSTGIEVLGDSSQNIRFSASKNYAQTHIERLRSSSMVDRSPKKFKFIDKKYGFSSDNIYEFSIWFDNKHHQWKYMRFMPFPSVIEWVTKDKLMLYLTQWVKTFEEAGWERIEYPESDNPRHIQNFKLPMKKVAENVNYCTWTTKENKATISVRLRSKNMYKSYLPKKDRKKLNIPPEDYPDGYIVFIDIVKKWKDEY